MERGDRGRGDQQPRRHERQMPLPEEHDAARLSPHEIHRKSAGEIVIPGQEKGIRQATNKTIAGVQRFLNQQLEVEKLTALAQKAAENTKNGSGLQRTFEAIAKNPGGVARAGKLALGPAIYAATEWAAYYLDTSMADTLNAVGDAHFNAARRALTDVVNESDPTGKSIHRRTAEGALRDAYDLYEADLAARDGKVLPKTAQIEAHLRATETALLVAAINRMDPHTQAAVPTWAEYARLHHNEYLTLTTEAANNGIALNEPIPHILLDCVTALPQLLFRKGHEPGYFEDKASERTTTHERRLSELPAEQQDFQAVYLQLIQPPQFPPDRRELT